MRFGISPTSSPLGPRLSHPSEALSFIQNSGTAEFPAFGPRGYPVCSAFFVQTTPLCSLSPSGATYRFAGEKGCKDGGRAGSVVPHGFEPKHQNCSPCLPHLFLSRSCGTRRCFPGHPVPALEIVSALQRRIQA